MRVPKLLVLDEGTALGDQARTATSGLRPRPTVVSAEVSAGLEEIVAAEGAFDVIIAGPQASTEAGLATLRMLRTRSPATKVIFLFEQWPTRSLRDTVRTGAVDILQLPVSDGVMLESVEQALSVGWTASGAPAVEKGRQPGKGTVVAVVAATGGCGKTFFATNLAYHLQAKSNKRTCLIDLDLQFGELSTALRLRPKKTIADLVAQNVDAEELRRPLEEHLVQHDTGIYVLAAPDEPAEADAVGPADVARVIEATRSAFDYVVLDTPAAFSETVLVALEHAARVFAVATLDLPSIRNLGILLSTFKRLKVPAEEIDLILNKVEPDVGMDVERVEKYFPKGFSMVIPYGREVNRALNMGMPMLAFAPGSAVSKALGSALSHMVEPRPGGLPEGGKRRRHLIHRRHRATG